MPKGIYIRTEYHGNLMKGNKNALGAKRSKKTREQMRKAKIGEKNPMYKKEFSVEHRNKMSQSRIGKKHWHWKEKVYRNGYIVIHKPKHPFAGYNGYVREHRLIVEKEIGGYLHRWEVCHHINKIKDDNRIENLMAFKSNSIHIKFEKGNKVDSNDIIFDGRGLLQQGVPNA